MPIISADILDFLVTGIFLEEGIIHFFLQLKYWNWSCYQFWLRKMHNKKQMYLNYNGKTEGVFSTKRYNISARCIFVMYSRNTEASWCHVALKSHNTCISQLASSIVFGCLSPSFGQVARSKNERKMFDLRCLALRSVFYTVIIYVSLPNCNLL